MILLLSQRTKYILLALTAAVVVLFIYAVHHILNPFIWAIITAYLFNPLVTVLNKRIKAPRFLVVLVLYFVIFAILSRLFMYVLPSLREELSDIPDLLLNLKNTIFGSDAVRFLGFDIDVGRLARTAGSSVSTGFPVRVWDAIRFFFKSILDLIIYLVVTFYLLLDGHEFAERFGALFPPKYSHEIADILRKIDQVLGSYLRGELILVMIQTVFAWVVMSLVLRLQYGGVLAGLAGIGELFPVVGPFVAWGSALISGLFQPHIPYDWSRTTFAIAILIAYFVVRQVTDVLIIPNLIGRITRLHPALVLFAVFCGSYLDGLTGAFLAVPTAATVRVLAVYIYEKVRTEVTIPAQPEMNATGATDKEPILPTALDRPEAALDQPSAKPPSGREQTSSRM